jgi:hypothetical protein
MPAGRPPALTEPNELDEAIENYQLHCEETKDPFTLIGLACFMGINRSTLREYNKKTEFSATYKKAVTIAEEHLVSKALKGEYNAAVSIFLLKNNHKYTDKPQEEKEERKRKRVTIARRSDRT